MIDLLDGRWIVLVLPDDTKRTLSMAHRFYPRFFPYITTTYDALCAVLYKMTNKTTPIKEGKNGK